MAPQAIHEFQETVWEFYRTHGRDLPWRHEPFDPYKILLSEMMLQQTQVSRVIEKYQQFLEVFPSLQNVADATLAEVIVAWSGLGYNRRAKYLHDAAKILVGYGGQWTLADLQTCKGIGYNTAAAVVTYAYNQPAPFIETNVRTVLIHHFLSDQDNVDDRTLMELMEQLLDREHPREFMWAMMDYGSYLKTTAGNASRRSKHYAKQSTFEGSARQIRGEVLRQLANGAMSFEELKAAVNDPRVSEILQSLEADELISQTKNKFVLGR